MERTKKVEIKFFELEKYANLNFEGFYKILKKHDKHHPEHPIQALMYETILSAEWAQGYSSIIVDISELLSQIRGDAKGKKNEDAAQNFVRTTTKYWVTQNDITFVKMFLLEHLPVFRFKSDNFAGDSQLVSSTYLDNSSLELYHGRLDKTPGAIALRLRWYGNEENPKRVFVERKTHQESWTGNESVKERVMLYSDKLIDFLNGRYTLEQALNDEAKFFKSESDKENFTRLFSEIA